MIKISLLSVEQIGFVRKYITVTVEFPVCNAGMYKKEAGQVMNRSTPDDSSAIPAFCIDGLWEYAVLQAENILGAILRNTVEIRCIPEYSKP